MQAGELSAPDMLAAALRRTWVSYLLLVLMPIWGMTLAWAITEKRQIKFSPTTVAVAGAAGGLTVATAFELVMWGDELAVRVLATLTMLAAAAGAMMYFRERKPVSSDQKE
jgi:hypothetical protein